MVEYLPDAIRKYPVSVAVALIPIIIGNLLISPLLQGPDINISALELHDQAANISSIYTIIQNVGNLPAEHIRVYFDTKNNYNLVSFNSTDTTPTEIHEDGNFRIGIDRLSPQSYVILKSQSQISNTTKTIWLTSDKETKIITLPYNSTDSGVSSVDLTKDERSLFITTGAGFFTLIIFRYVNFYKSELKRRDFLGIHSIKIVKFRSNYFWVGFAVIIISMLIGNGIDTNNNSDQILNYKKYLPFHLDTNLSPKTFLKINDPNAPVVSGGTVFSFLAILFALYISNKDINLPKFNWSLKPSPSNIKLNQITSSYLKAEETSLTTKKDWSSSNSDIFVVSDDQKIIGLLSKKEIEKLDVGKKAIKSIFNNKNLPSPKWNKSSFQRDNFVVIDESMTLEELKKEMEKSSKKYAVIQDSNKKFLGVVSYDVLFGIPDIFGS